MSRLVLDRRTLLRGLGAAISLPLLDAMVPSTARATAGVNRRFVAFYMPNGRPQATWTPAEVGPAWVAPRSLELLAPVRDDVRVLSGLNSWGRGIGDHDSAARGALSRALVDPDVQQRWGSSLDVEIAAAIAGDTRVSMLALATDAATRCRQVSCEWMAHVSWYDELNPVPRDRSALAVFERLFGAADPGAAPSVARRAQGRSVLDAVLGDANALSARVGASDRAIVDAYLTSIRELETRIDHPVTGACVPATPPPAAPPDPDAAARAMIDLTVLALQCDVTRVVSLMAGNEGGERSLAFLGYPCCAYHEVSHFNAAVHTEVVRWQVGLFAELVARLGAVVEPDGLSLLDKSFALFVSGMGDSAEHMTLDVPVLLAGRGGNGAAVGGHQAFSGRTLADLHLGLLQAYDVPAADFGAIGTTPLLDLT